MLGNLQKSEMTHQKAMHVRTSLMLNCSFIVPVINFALEEFLNSDQTENLVIDLFCPNYDNR